MSLKGDHRMTVNEAKAQILRAIYQTSPLRYLNISEVEAHTGINFSVETGERKGLERALRELHIDRFTVDLTDILEKIAPKFASVRVNPNGATITTAERMMSFMVFRAEKATGKGMSYKLVSNDLGEPVEIHALVTDTFLIEFLSPVAVAAVGFYFSQAA